jgi:predicted PurR-regulated permease PerM
VKGLLVLGYFVLYGQLEGNVLGPFVFRRTVHLDPLVTLLGILFLAELLGIAGAVVAVPAVALAQIVVRELLAARRDRVAAEAAGQSPGETGREPRPAVREERRSR